MANKDFKDLGKDMEEKLKKAIRASQSKGFLRSLGEELLERIRKRTKLGYGVNKTGDKRSRFEPLTNGYKTWRRNNKSKLDGTTRPNKANLTQTGKMLDNIIYKIVRSGLKFTGKDPETKNKIKWNEGKRNKERIFLRLSDKDEKLISMRIRNLVRKIFISKG